MQSGVADQLAAVSPAVAEQLQDAIDTGGPAHPGRPSSPRASPRPSLPTAASITRRPSRRYEPRRGRASTCRVRSSARRSWATPSSRPARRWLSASKWESVRNTIRDELNAINRFRPDERGLRHPGGRVLRQHGAARRDDARAVVREVQAAHCGRERRGRATVRSGERRPAARHSMPACATPASTSR